MLCYLVYRQTIFGIKSAQSHDMGERKLWNGFGLWHHRMYILHFARFVTRPIHHHPSDDSIPSDRKWGYTMKLGVTAAFSEDLFFENFNALLLE